MKQLLFVPFFLAFLGCDSKEIYTVTVDNLHFRDQPSLEASVIDRFAPGEKLAFLGEETAWTQQIELGGLLYDEPWVKVAHEGRTGWIYRGGLDVSGSPIRRAPKKQASASTRKSAGRNYLMSDALGVWRVKMTITTSDCKDRYQGTTYVEQWQVLGAASTEMEVKVSGRNNTSGSYRASWESPMLYATDESKNIWGKVTSWVDVKLEMVSPIKMRGSRTRYNQNCTIYYGIEAEKL